jgi:dTDP-4-amino-4,6-dideoxygalactose transaminase
MPETQRENFEVIREFQTLTTSDAQLIKVPFADLYSQYLKIQPEIDAAISQVIRESAFIRGHFVDEFESNFARAIGAQNCVSCANGTDAIYIAMRALGVRPGDEVIAPAHSWIATTETITQAGGTVVFCDTDPDTFTIDVTKLEALVTPRTVGIIPVHLFGQPANMAALMEIAKRRGLWVIEDCAQAHLAEFAGRQVGTFGDAATFSFYPGKNLGAMGDAGAIVTGSRELASRMAMFARHGGLTKGDHQIEGINSRLDGLQAAILSVKLRYLTSWTERRRVVASEYSRLLETVRSVVLPKVAPDRTHVWHLYVIQVGDRDGLARHLAANGVQTVVNYPVALPFLPAYRRFNHVAQDFPVAHGHSQRMLSLPIYPEMTSEQIRTVCALIAAHESKSG